MTLQPLLFAPDPRQVDFPFYCFCLFLCCYSYSTSSTLWQQAASAFCVSWLKVEGPLPITTQWNVEASVLLSPSKTVSFGSNRSYGHNTRSLDVYLL